MYYLYVFNPGILTIDSYGQLHQVMIDRSIILVICYGEFYLLIIILVKLLYNKIESKDNSYFYS